ncbi:MAG: hypothetical protein Q4B27_05095 [Candidatus Saccharibacteria bacterium]|nr:hypothetical protein [Candidatus Saccharibacteria bacterium]
MTNENLHSHRTPYLRHTPEHRHLTTVINHSLVTAIFDNSTSSPTHR